MLLVAVPALAQVPEIRAGEPLGGTLSATDTRTADGSFSDGYIYHGKGGERISVSLQSDDFDAYLWFARIGEDLTPVDLTGNDDGGEGTDARMEVTLEQDGTYIILASSYSEGETGAYRLSVASDRVTVRAARPSAAGSEITLGVEVRGTLGAGDAVLPDDSYYDLYTFSGRAGQQIDILLSSDDFDTYLAFGTMEGATLQVSDSDDDGAGGTNSRLRVTLPTDGMYGIRANSLYEDETGTYYLLVTESSDATPASDRRSGPSGAGDRLARVGQAY